MSAFPHKYSLGNHEEENRTVYIPDNPKQNGAVTICSEIIVSLSVVRPSSNSKAFS